MDCKSDTRVIIMADGAGSRWMASGGGANPYRRSWSVWARKAIEKGFVDSLYAVFKRTRKAIGKRLLPKRKQLLRVDGETLLERQVRMLKERGITEIFISSRFPECGVLGVERYVPTNNIYEIDRFRSCKPLWNPAGYTMYLYGDVFYTDDALDQFVAAKETAWWWLGRWSYEGVVQTQEPEIFGFAFHCSASHDIDVALELVRSEYEAGSLARCIGWELLRTLEYGSPYSDLPEHAPASFSEVFDLTNDFDTFGEFREWKKLYHLENKRRCGRNLDG